MPRPSSLACTTAPRVKPAGRLRMAAAQFPSPRRPRNAAAIPTSPSFRVAAPAPGPAAPAAPRPSTANGGAPRVKPAGRLRMAAAAPARAPPSAAPASPALAPPMAATALTPAPSTVTTSFSSATPASGRTRCPIATACPLTSPLAWRRSRRSCCGSPGRHAASAGRRTAPCCKRRQQPRHHGSRPSLWLGRRGARAEPSPSNRAAR